MEADQDLTEQVPDRNSIDSAHARISAYIHRTPLSTSAQINEMAGCEVFFKCENLQKVGAFKMRGATNAVLQLSKDQLESGVGTHSSGNHAQALALAAKNVGATAHIVMPRNAPEVKKLAVAGYGAIISECEPTLAARESTMDEVIAQTGVAFIHPYDNYNIIAGQATAAKEIYEDQDIDIIMCPVGGGGLLAGTCLATQFYSPNTEIVAAEPSGANDAWQSLLKGHLIPSVDPQTIADGLLTSVGQRNWPIIKEYVKDILLVDDPEIISAMYLIWERMKLIIEPSSAVPVAALLANPRQFRGKRVAIILSGGNVDFSKLPQR